SFAFAASAINAGCWSTMRFQQSLASSYPSSPGKNTSPVMLSLKSITSPFKFKTTSVVIGQLLNITLNGDASEYASIRSTLSIVSAFGPTDRRNLRSDLPSSPSQESLQETSSPKIFRCQPADSRYTKASLWMGTGNRAMESITPVDIENTRLRRTLFGYRRGAADALIQGATKSLDLSLQEAETLRRELAEARRELDAFRAQENTLKEALLLAQKTADETRALAHRQAATIVEEARQAALAERMALQQQVSELRWDLERGRDEKRRFEAEFQDLLGRYRRETETPPLGLAA
ncbi:DivIVA domain-containing protein, partial [bacterium]